MNKKSILFGLAGLAIIIGVVIYLKNEPQSTTQTPTPENNQTEQEPVVSNKVEIVVNYSSTAKFEPATTQVKEGQEVTLKITSDIADEVHLHGYDLSKDLEAGEQGEINFVADKTGRFEFELEEHEIALGALEVYPK